MNCAVILTTYHRTEFLPMSVYTHARSLHACPDAAGGKNVILIANDDPKDHSVAEFLHSHACPHRTDVREIVVPNAPSGSHITGYNLATIQAMRLGVDVAIYTHPEILFSRDIVELACRYAADDVYVAFRPFWIPGPMSSSLHQLNGPLVSWRRPETLEYHAALYSNPEWAHEGDPEKGWNRDMRSRRTWESTTTFAMRVGTIGAIGGFREFNVWGPDDPDFWDRRRHLGIRTHVVTDGPPGGMVYHIYHGPEGKIDQEDVCAHIIERGPLTRETAILDGPVRQAWEEIYAPAQLVGE